MPRISEFHGIRICMYYGDHNPPHFHARSGADDAEIDIANGTLLNGAMPRTKMRQVLRWWRLRREELAENWNRARQGVPLQPIERLED